MKSEFFVPQDRVSGRDRFKTGTPPQNRRKSRALNFYKIPAELDLDLAKTKANWTAWAMVRALYEAWFRIGSHPNHPNPFSLAACDTKKWGLSRMQKHRALELLLKTSWVLVDRSDPNNPLVTLTWLPIYKSYA
jgi:hypothetical protein